MKELNEATENIKVVNVIRVAGKRAAVIEYKTQTGTFYGLQYLYRTKEIAIAAARKGLS